MTPLPRYKTLQRVSDLRAQLCASNFEGQLGAGQGFVSPMLQCNGHLTFVQHRFHQPSGKILSV
jgi:hypothetical protein